MTVHITTNGDILHGTFEYVVDDTELLNKKIEAKPCWIKNLNFPEYGFDGASHEVTIGSNTISFNAAAYPKSDNNIRDKVFVLFSEYNDIECLYSLDTAVHKLYMPKGIEADFMFAGKDRYIWSDGNYIIIPENTEVIIKSYSTSYNQLFSDDTVLTKLDDDKLLSYKFTMGKSDITIRPDNIQDTYTVTIPKNVKVTRNNQVLNNGDKISAGDFLTISAIVPDGYTLKSLNVNGAAISSGSTYTVGNENIVITVEFTEILDVPTYDPSVAPSSSKNIGQHNYINAYRHADVIYSYLTELPNGTIERVECIKDKGVVIENYFKDGRTISQKTIPLELPRFGGFFSGAKYNFLVFGQSNFQKDDDCEVIRIVKYNKRWERLDAFCGKATISKEMLGYEDYETTEAFHAGTLRMAEIGDNLIVHTCHEMYNGHQSNMPFMITQSNMEFLGIRGSYASHSFNQLLIAEGNSFYQVDHGDAFPRGINLSKYPIDYDTNPDGHKFQQVLTILGEYDEYGNDTGLSVGGLELSDYGVLLVGNSVQQDDINTYDPFGQRNIFVISTPADFTESKILWLTNYSSGVEMGNPYLVKIDGNKFALMWEETSSNNTDLKYMTINSNGDVIRHAVNIPARLSDCQPIKTSDNHIMWYYTNNSAPYFVTIDFDGNIISANVPDIPDEHKHISTSRWESNLQNHWKVCTECGKNFDMGAHESDGGIVTVQPTTTNSGIVTYSCLVCGRVIGTNTLPPKPDNDPPYIPPYYPPNNDTTTNQNYPIISDDNHDYSNITVSLECILNDLSGKKSHMETKKRFFDNSAVIKVTNSETANNAAQKAVKFIPGGSEHNIIYSFDISIYNAKTAKKMQLRKNGYITFEIPVPKDMADNAKEINVYHINDGTPELLPSSIIVSDNVSRVRFTVDSLSPFMFTLYTEYGMEDVSSSAGVTSETLPLNFAVPTTNGVGIPVAKLPRIMEFSNKKRRYRILRNRCLNDLVFVY